MISFDLSSHTNEVNFWILVIRRVFIFEFSCSVEAILALKSERCCHNASLSESRDLFCAVSSSISSYYCSLEDYKVFTRLSS